MCSSWNRRRRHEQRPWKKSDINAARGVRGSRLRGKCPVGVTLSSDTCKGQVSAWAGTSLARFPLTAHLSPATASSNGFDDGLSLLAGDLDFRRAVGKNSLHSPRSLLAQPSLGPRCPSARGRTAPGTCRRIRPSHRFRCSDPVAHLAVTASTRDLHPSIPSSSRT